MRLLVLIILSQLRMAVSYVPLYNPYYGDGFIKFYREMRPNNTFLETVFENINLLNESSGLCHNHLKIYEDALQQNNTSWQSYFLDSSGGALDSGWLTGNTVNLGDFDECVSQHNDEFKGKYCLLKIELKGERPHRLPYLPNNTALVFSICVPDSCNDEDLETLIRPMGELQNFTMTSQCQTARPAITTIDIAVMSFFGAMLILVLSTTIPKEWVPKDLERFGGYFETRKCFDLMKNLETLHPAKNTSNSLVCVYAIKLTCQICIIWYHIVANGLAGNTPIKNKFFLNDFFRSWIGAVEIELVLAVDAFFMMSGLLAYNSIKKKTDMNIAKYYVHRYLRLTPPLMACILFISTFRNKLCSGPLCVIDVEKEKELCRRYWWTNLLYINNYYPGILGSCMPHAWYLAADWQLFMFISPLVILVVNKYPQHVYKCIFVIFILSISSTFGVVFAYDLSTDSVWLKSKNEALAYFNMFYITPYVRAGPWAVGLFLGAFLHDTKKNPIELSTRSVALCWSVCAFVLCSCLILYMPFLRGDHPGVWAKSLFLSLQRNFFVIAVAWVIFACTINRAGPLGYLFKWSIFEPLGKLSYSTYLIHMSIVALYQSETRTSYYYSTAGQLPAVLGIIAISTFAGLCLYLTFEAPFIQIEKLIFKKENHINSFPQDQEVYGKIQESQGGLNNQIILSSIKLD